MTTATATPPAGRQPRAFAVSFKQLERWDVDFFRRIEWTWPREVLRPLGEALLRNVREVPPDMDKAAVPIIEKISFGGAISLTNPENRPKYKGRLFWAESGELVYSKIRVKQGSLAVVPPSMQRIAVSAEYPVYAVDGSVADGDFLLLVLRSGAFQSFLEALSHGGGTKTRLHPKEFEGLLVPVPPLPVQQTIVEYWNKAQQKAGELRMCADKAEACIGGMLLSKLGVPNKAADLLPKVFALPWSNLERWSLGYLRRALTVGKNLRKAKYPLVTLGDVAAVTYGLQKCPSNRPGKHARPYLRVANVQAGELDLSEIKYIDVPDSMMEAYRLEPEDLLVCEGNSADLVGRPAIWSGEIPDCVHQNHVLKVRLDREKTLPRFILEYMHTAPARNYFRGRAKFTTNLASLNGTDLRELPIPIPPLAIQQRIVTEVQQRRAELGAARQEAQQLAEHAKAEVEAMILGKRRVKST